VAAGRAERGHDFDEAGDIAGGLHRLLGSGFGEGVMDAVAATIAKTAPCRLLPQWLAGSGLTQRKGVSRLGRGRDLFFPRPKGDALPLKRAAKLLDICLWEPHAQPVQCHLEGGIVGWIAHRRTPSVWLKLFVRLLLE